MKLKQCIFALVAMLLCLSFPANAQVAKIGETEYTAFSEAITAANAMSGDVTVEICSAVEFVDGMELKGSYTSISFIGKTADAKMTINQSAGGDYLEAHGKVVAFTDLILAKANPAWSGNSGHMGSYFSIQGGTVTYTNCTFPNGACTSGGTATYTNCTFQNASEYGLWVYDDAVVTVNGGTIDSTKGIKVYSEDETTVTSTLTVQNATFTENVTAKPAVAVGYAQSITLIGNTYNNPTAHVELDSGSDADCEGITFVAQDAEGNDISSTMEMTDRSNSQAACGVLVDGKVYTTVTTAVAEIEEGSTATVTLLYASTETVELPEGVTLDKNGYTADGVTVPTTTAVAKIGEQGYASFDAALTDASAMTGDVTVEVYDKVTLNSNLTGSYSSIKFVGKDTDAEIYLDVQGYITATGKTVAFEDLTLSKAEGGYITNAGFMNVAFGVYDVTEVTYTNCIFANGAYASSGVVTFTGCTFYRSHDKYGLWAYGNVETIVDGCTFADYRGIKMYAEGAAKTVDLTVKSTDFSAVTDKPAIVLTYGESVTLEGNTYSSTGTFELDLDGTPAGTPVTSDVAPVCVNDNGACGVLVDGKIYTTASEAAAVATEGSNVTLLYSTTETVEFAEGVNLALASGVTAENVTVATSAVAYIGETGYATLADAVADAESGATITLLNGEHELPLFSDKELTFVGESKDGVIVNDAPDARTQGWNGSIFHFENLTAKGATANYHGLANGVVEVTYKNCNINGLRFLYAATVSFEGCAFNAQGVEHSFWTYGSSDITVTDCTFTYTDRAVNCYSENGAEHETDIAFTGCTFTYAGTAEAPAGAVEINSGSVKSIELTMDECEAPAAGSMWFNSQWDSQDGANTVVVVDDVKVWPLVAQVGETKYADLQEAISVAAPNGTVELLSDVTVDEWIMFSERLTISNGDIITIEFNGLTINGNGKTVTIKDIESAGNGARLFYDATNLNINNLTFNFVDNAANLGGIGLTAGTIENVTFNGGGYAIFPGTGEVTITGCTFKTNSTSIYYEEERDNLVVTGNTFENPDNVNVILLRGNTVFTNNNVISGRTVNVVSGSPVVTGNDFNDVRFKVYNVATATIENNTINTLAFNDESVVYSTFNSNTLSEDAQAVLDAATFPAPVAKVGDVEYTSLQEALNAAAAGTGNVTVTILADVDLTGVTWTPVTVSAPGYPVVTVEGGNHTITGLTDMLFAGTWAGGSGLIIKDLTIANSAIVNDKDDTKGTVGVGAFIGFPQASATITLENCHLVSSSVEGGHWTGGLIGYAAGYAGTDGPVFMNLTIKGCSVTGSTITGKGSVGGIIGHGSGNAWTNVVIEETTVQGNTVTSTGSSNVKAGAVMGTIGAAGQATTVNGVTKTGGIAVSATVANNTVTSNGTAITTIYGRQGTDTGMLYVAGGSYDNYPIEEGVAYAAPIEGYEIVENADGTYGVQEIPAYVAKIGEQDYFETLAAAVAAANNGETITLIADVESADGVTITDKNITIDLNGNTFTVTEGSSTNSRNMLINGSSVVTVKNGTMVAAGDINSGTYGTVRTEGTANVTLTGLKLYNYRGNGLNIKAVTGTTVAISNTEIYSQYGGGIEAAGATITVENVTVEQKGMWTAPYNSMAISVNGGGKVTVNSGTFSTECITAEEAYNQGTSHGPWVAGVLNSGGTLIINGGTFSNDNYGDNSLATAARGAILADTGANIEINGGTFNALKSIVDIQNNLGDASKNPAGTITGGTFSADPTNNYVKVADGYVALPDLAGNYVVGAKPTATVNNLGMTTVAAGDYMVYGNGDNTADMPLSFVMQFLADQTEEDMATSPYADWYGDFVITFTGIENGSFTADGCYLAGHYGSFGWVKVPVDGMEIEEGVRYPVMLGVGMGQKYDYICSSVEDFRCALYLTPEVLEANPNIQVNLELAVVDNSQGEDAAASALINNDNVYSVTNYTYDAEDFVVDPNYIEELTIDDAEGLDYTNDTDKTVGTLTYKRTLIEGIWNPLYLPFEVELTDELLAEYDFADYNQMISSDTNGDRVPDSFTMELFVYTSGTLEANYPYFVCPKTADACNLELILSDVTLYAAKEVSLVTSSVKNTFKLSGTYKAMDAASLAGCYAISTDGEWALTEGLKPFRLYFTITDNNGALVTSTASKSIRIVVRGEDGFTGIEEVTDETNENVIFDLQGRRILEPQKGEMYIINGKKVIY